MSDVRDDRIEIANGAVDRIGGARPEPEERPAARIIDMAVDVNTAVVTDPNVSFRALAKVKVGETASQIIGQTTAGEMAENLATTCRFCQWWDRDKVARTVLRLKGETAPQAVAKLNDLRGAVAAAGVSTQADIDATLTTAMGECAAYTDVMKDEILTHALARCPERDAAGLPLPRLFKIRGAGARRDAAAVRDHILRTAQGK